MIRRPPRSTLFPSPPLSRPPPRARVASPRPPRPPRPSPGPGSRRRAGRAARRRPAAGARRPAPRPRASPPGGYPARTPSPPPPPRASDAPGRASSRAASPRRGRRAGRPAGARTRGALAFPNRLREERRVHPLHRARLALGASGPLAAVLLDRLLLAEVLAALRAAVFVDWHGGMNVFRAQTAVKLTECAAVSVLMAI